MNANELADKLDKLEIVYRLPNQLIGNETHEQAALRCNPNLTIKKEAATMLRQQQAEIEALKEPKIPLLEQEIKFILGQGQCWQGEDCSMPNLMYIIRAVEATHGIGVKQNEQ